MLDVGMPQVTPGPSRPVDPAALKAQTDAEARRDMEAMAGFSGRVKEWWQDFTHDALSHHQEGGVRVTAKGEDGLLRPCCAFVKPLQLGRLVPAADSYLYLHLPACDIGCLVMLC